MRDHAAPEPSVLRERILVEATRLFAARGYHGIAMREIAEAAGLSKPGLYYHFKDKEDLFLAILGQNLDVIARIVAQAQAEPSARAQVRHLMGRLFDLAPTQRAIMRLANQEMVHLSPEAQLAFSQQYQQQFIGVIEAMLQAGVIRGELRSMDASVATWILLGMLYPFFNAPQARGSESPEHLIDQLLTVFFDGAAAQTR